ncbi:MAG: ATP-dependent Clp protease ATP-binding subunit, partial [Oscillospiraceae bacterium]|nr:ATP-dependent Clp protease ATP-binding subunit [Oscillospiraceae bacterium]
MNLNQDAYGKRSIQLFQAVFQFAARMGHGFIGSEHLLWGIAKEQGQAAHILKGYGLEADFIEEYIKQHDHDAVSAGGGRIIHFTAELERVVERAEDTARKLSYREIEPEHLLWGILTEKQCAAAQLILSLDVDPDDMAAVLEGSLRTEQQIAPLPEKTRRKKPAGKTLEKFSRDLTAEAEAGKLDPMIGREAEVERIVQILSRRTKNNPVLVGEPGVGKTAVAEGLAQRIADDRVPKNLANKRILSLDLTGMLSGTRFRGDFEERIKAFIDEAKEAGDVILFLDELHTLIGAGAGSDGAMDAANILKPVWGRGELQVIGATTLQEYRRYIEKDAALERRFQPVSVEEPAPEDAVKILTGLRERYESFHELTITDEAIDAAVTLSARYIQDRYLPDKAIDLMDEAASRVRTRGMTVPPHLRALDDEIQAVRDEKSKAAAVQDYERAAVLRDRQAALTQELEEKRTKWQTQQGGHVTAQDIAAVVSAWTKIPVTMLTQDESQRLLALEETLHNRV